MDAAWKALGPTGPPRACGSSRKDESATPTPPARRTGRRRGSRLLDRRTRDRLRSHARRARTTARHVSDDRTTHPESPPDRATPHQPRRRSEKPQGRTHADREVLRRSRGRKARCVNAAAGHVRRPAASGASARRDPRVLKGTKPQERRPIDRDGTIGPVVTRIRP